MAEECICHLGLWPKYSKKETIARVLLSLDIFCSVVYILAVLNDLTNLNNHSCSYSYQVH